MSNPRELHEILDDVKDQESFFVFVEALVKEREAAAIEFRKNPKTEDILGWQNHSIEDFLEAALAWAKDTDFPKVADWKSFATFLSCGKTYE
jgi:hypothetical protein